MPISSQYQPASGSRSDTCNDPVVGAILSGWRYDISDIPKDLRGDYEAHLTGCPHCRRRQRVHRTVDVLLLSVTTLSFVAFLLAALTMHRLELYSHMSTVHVHLHAAEESGPLARVPASLAISLEAVAIAGVVVSMLLWLLVALATPVPSMISAMFRQRTGAAHPGDELNKQAA